MPYVLTYVPTAFKVPLCDRLAHYVERAQADLQLVVQAKDGGMLAGRTSNACVWLSLVAALSRSSWDVSAPVATPVFPRSPRTFGSYGICSAWHMRRVAKGPCTLSCVQCCNDAA